MATPCIANNEAPIYCASMIPGSASERRNTPKAMGRVPARDSITKNQFPINFPIKISNSPNGYEESHSMVPVLFSSATDRMVSAGIKTAKSQGSRSNSGRRLARLSA